MAYELKPCPFCGGKPYLEQRHRAFVKGQSTRVALVRCTECEARTQKFDLRDFGHTSISREANLKAIEAWNMRAVDAVPVVRCKDCIHCTPVEGGLPLCTQHNIAVSYNEFCSYGERNDGGGGAVSDFGGRHCCHYLPCFSGEDE